jgi:hypothetical protein
VKPDFFAEAGAGKNAPAPGYLLEVTFVKQFLNK